MRKFISIIMCALMLMSSAFATAQTPNEAFVNTDHLQVVKELGILDGFSNYESDGTSISRGEFASVIISLFNTSAFAGEQVFADVNSAHPYFNEIGMAKSLGIMVGDENGNFAPEQSVTYAQAVKCLLYVLGYTAYAEAHGGYPSGYFMQAERLDILERVNYQGNEKISRAALAQMIYNCLDVALMEVVYVGESTARSNEKNETILSRYFGMRRFEGVLSNVDGRSVLSRGKEINEGYLKIGSTVLEYTDSAIAEFLGYRMEAYATDGANGIEKLICAFPTNKNQELMIKVSDLNTDDAAFSLTNFVYFDSKGNLEEAELTEEHRFMYNGAYDYDFDIVDLDFDTGYVKLIDNNDDAVYDVCFVWDYENFVFESASEEMVNCHYNKNIKHDSDKTYRVLGVDGERGGWEQLLELSNWDVLSVAQSKDGSLVTVYVSRGGVHGTVASVANDGETTVEIDGQNYTVSEQYINQPANTGYIPIKVGMTSEFYFDIAGEIAAVYQVGSASGEYGYLFGIQKEGGLSDYYQMKIFTEHDKTEIYYTDDKIVFSSNLYDGKTVKIKEAVDSFCEGGRVVPQMVKFSADEDGILTEIQKFTDATALGYNLDKFSRDFNMGTVSGANTEKFRFLDVAHTFGTGSLFEKQFHITETTKVFYAPKKNGVIDENNMRIVDSSMFEQDYYDNIQAFDCDDTYTAPVILHTPEKTGDPKPSNYFVSVNKVYVGMDSNGDAKTMLSGFYSGTEKSFVYVSEDGSVPEEGSIILHVLNLDDELIVKTENVVYSPSQEVRLYEKLEHVGSGQVPLLWSQMGRIWRKNGSTITVYTGNERPWASYLNKPTIYKVSKNKIEIVDESALIPSTGNPQSVPDGSLVLLNYRYHYVREAFVFEE